MEILEERFVLTTAVKKLLSLKKKKKICQGGSSAGGQSPALTCGGRHIGKTFAILTILIDRAAKTPGLEISVVSESFPHLKRGCIKDFKKIMLMLNKWDDNAWNSTAGKYTFGNNSYIEFFSVDQPDKLRGARRHVLYVNEANNVPFEAYTQLAIRTSKEIWIDYNPTAKFWAHTEVMNEDDADFLIITYKDNEALDSSIVQELEKKRDKGKTNAYWANWWNVYGLGQIGQLEGACIPEYNTIDEIPVDAKLLGFGLDFGFTNDPTSLIALYEHGSTIIADELVYTKGLVNQEIARLFDKFAVRGHRVFADSAEPKSIEEIRRMGYNIKPTRKGKDSINYGIQLINESNLVVTSKSTNLIKELQSYVWDRDRTGKSTNKPVGGFDHAIDAMRYGFMSLVGRRRAVYAIH